MPFHLWNGSVLLGQGQEKPFIYKMEALEADSDGRQLLADLRSDYPGHRPLLQHPAVILEHRGPTNC